MDIKTEKLDYLVIGTITRDIVGDHFVYGGTVTYSALCANNLGCKTGILTAGEANLKLPDDLDGIPFLVKESPVTTTYENIETDHGRVQILHDIALPITKQDIPKFKYQPSIVHLGPLADDLELSVLEVFPDSFIGLTPQGWMRQRDAQNIVKYKEWENAESFLNRANAVVLSIEDVQGDRQLIEDYASKTKILALTEGYNGASVYWHGDVRNFSAPIVPVVDPTGAGDIFAATFFTNLFRSKDPWEAAKKAIAIASASVSRVGIKGVPTPEEMRSLQIEIVEGRKSNG
jgi:hypothetical protein